MASLGSGPCGLELAFARAAPNARITCVDVNAALLELGRERAQREHLRLDFLQADLNMIRLPENAFDIVFCHATLHHVLNLERLAGEITRCLRPHGELVVVDVVTRNGYRMWPETRAVVTNIWRTLPDRFRVNHTAYGKPQLDADIWEADTSQASMECIRAEDILPVLNGSFRVREFVPYFSICRRFFDTMYGPNYDLSLPLDRALLAWIWELDLYYIVSNRLKPETFFGIFAL